MISDWANYQSILNTNIDVPMVLGFLLAILTLLLGSALVSGSEVAYFSISPEQRALLKKNDGSTSSQRILSLVEKPRYLLATILIANNLFNIAIVIISYYVTDALLNIPPNLRGLDFLINTVIITFLLVLLGEVMPKVYATHNNLKLAEYTALPLIIMRIIFKPVSALLVKSTDIIEQRLDKLGKARETEEKEIQQIGRAIDLVAGGNHMQPELQMLKDIVKFRDITVNQIMKPRPDIFAVEESMDYNELIETLSDQNFSRVPVYAESLDNIKGILYVKDLLAHLNQTDDFDWLQLCREPMYVPESKKTYELLKEMQSKQVHLAIVADEYGGTSGLITLEDILEEIVGDIKDEFDTDEEDISYEQKADNIFVFEGKAMLYDACKLMGIDPETFNDVEGDFESLAGLVLEIAGKFPQLNETVYHHDYAFTVIEKKGNRIDRVRITIPPKKQTPDNEAEKVA